jgi:hypothetical protein
MPGLKGIGLKKRTWGDFLRAQKSFNTIFDRGGQVCRIISAYSISYCREWTVWRSAAS